MEFPAEGDHTKHGTVLEQHQSFHDCEGVDTDAQITGGRSLSSPPLVEDLFPGLRDNDGHPSEGADDILDVIKLLNVATIPVCIVGVNALRYYGAGRVVWEWDLCVPNDLLEDAKAVFEGHGGYEATKPPPLVMESMRHLNAIFKLKDVSLFFILTPSSQCFIDPNPEHCELSNKGIPYPKMTPFARSLLVLQDSSNLADFIDGMDLDEKWGADNIDFDNLQVTGAEFTYAQNIEFEARGLGQFNTNMDYRKRWNEVVQKKGKRIEPMKQGRYKTRWRRIKNDTDPRLRDRPF